VKYLESRAQACCAAVIGPEFIDAMLIAVDEAIADKGAPHVWLQEGKFYDGLFHWTRHPAFARLVLQSRLGEICGGAARRNTGQFFL